MQTSNWLFWFSLVILVASFVIGGVLVTMGVVIGWLLGFSFHFFAADEMAREKNIAEKLQAVFDAADRVDDIEKRKRGGA